MARLWRGVVAMGLVLAASMACAAPAYVWCEGEKPDKANFKVETNGGSPEIVSGGQMLQEMLDKPNLGKLGAGRELSYTLNVPAAGEYNVWLHLGLEFVRAPLSWRIDGGEWHEVKPTDLGVDLIEMGEWYEISWVRAGAVTLAAGARTLEIKADKPNGDRFILALDAICAVQGDWRPDAVLKPGEAPAGDLDKQAAARVVELPAAVDAKRATVPLDGAWQVGRFDDPDMDANTYEPEKSYPTDLVWRGQTVPADLFKTPVFNFAHRVVYRTKVNLPAALAGRSVYLDTQGANWIATVFVNGQSVGWKRSTRMPWRLDISAGLKPGVNELAVVIKSPWYGLNKGNKTQDESRTLPLTFWKYARQVASFFPSSKGDTDGQAVGLTDPLSLVICGGAAYVDDVFCRPQVVGGKKLTTEITLLNPSDKALEAEVTASCVFDGDGKVEKTFAPVKASLPAKGQATIEVSDAWPAAKLWWPGDDPAALYRLRTETRVGGQVVDVREQRFGFRDVTIEGRHFRINGVRRNFWNLLGGFRGESDEAKLAHFYRGNNRFERFSMDIGHELGGPLVRRANQLDWADTHGIAGRLSSMIDGMFITHELNNPTTWKFFGEQIEQMVRNNRNHPSVVVYSLENELMFITAALAYRGDMNRIEKDVRTNLFDVSHRWDPTRPAMLDGGGALQDNSAEICCTHYLEDGFHPDNATPIAGLKSQGLWVWDGNRPYCAGEVAFFQGDNADHAWIGGESAASGRAEALRAYSKYLRYVIERHRWNECAIICPWTGQDGSEDAHLAMSDLAAFTRHYNTTFFAGQPIAREVKVFNDTWSAKPLTFTWSFVVGGQKVAGASQTMNLEPGYNQVVNLTFPAPAVTRRTEGTLYLKVAQEGAKEFVDQKTYALFPTNAATAAKLTRPLFLLEPADGTFGAELAKTGVKATAVQTVAQAAAGGIIVVAPHLKGLKAATPDLVAYARAGGRVVCLEQDTPWEGTDLPAPLTVGKADNKRDLVNANFTFSQGQGLPLFASLGENDLSCWAGDEPTATKVWSRPSGAARSWVASGEGLKFSALVDLPLGPGQILATQLRVGDKLGIEPAARQLLGNLLSVADNYAPPSASVTLCAGGEWSGFLGAMGLKSKTADAPVAALDAKVNPILVVQANAANLAALAAAKAKVDAYAAAGGWLVLCGLEPDGLAAYNQLLGTQHVMREFRTERVKLQRDLLTSGLDSPDVTLYGEQVIAPWAGLRIASKETFTYCVDAGPNIAPFCFGPPNPNVAFNAGGGQLQQVNGLFNADFWWYIDQIPYQTIPPEKVLSTFELPGAAGIASIRIWNNANYDTAENCEIRVDGKTVAKVVLPNNNDLLEVPLTGVSGKSVAIVATSVRKRQDKAYVGLDEVQILRQAPAWAAGGKVVPLVDAGGLVKYPRGRGGVLLCNLKPSDAVKENVGKKQRILAVVLQNMGAAFGQ